MGISQIGTVGLMCSALVLSGCSAQAIRGEPAQTRDECRTDWLTERQSDQGANVSEKTGFERWLDGVLFNFVGFTTATDVADARYRACLERLGVTDVDAYNAQNEALGQEGPYLHPLAPRRPAHCPEYASVLYGGAGYCVGR
jgi:hypothetical protein